MPSDSWEVVEGFKVTVGVGVADQPVLNRTVSVAKVFSAGPGWIVIHAQMDGKPGPILGQSPVLVMVALGALILFGGLGITTIRDSR
jgi:hypothetical protein